ncbi:MAG: Zn-dependent hydrolase [bacterium]|nr:Zn-dependent hydrolase [bacterium]
MSISFMTTYDQLRVNAERLWRDFIELSQIGETRTGGVERLALSNEDLKARLWFANKLEATGLHVYDDEAGNVSGVLSAPNPKSKTFLIGSHLDGVPDGGRYDNAVGIICAMECARIIQSAGIKLPFHLEIINFTDGEGCWQSLFGSRALAGKLTENYMSDSPNDYAPFRAALIRAGISPSKVSHAHRDPNHIAGYLQIHIEQGYRLDEAKIPIGIVTNIIGRTTHQMTFYGEAGHSGTTKLDNRRDALRGAADFISMAHNHIREKYPQGVFNCGNITVLPGAFNIIPSEARLTVECRHHDERLLTEMQNYMFKLAQEVADTHHLTMKHTLEIHMPAATMSTTIINSIKTTCENLNIPFLEVVSYAGHDAQMVFDITPTGMIFIPSVGGISHSPKEFTEWDDIVRGANVLLQTVLRIADEYAQL